MVRGRTVASATEGDEWGLRGDKETGVAQANDGGALGPKGKNVFF